MIGSERLDGESGLPAAGTQPEGVIAVAFDSEGSRLTGWFYPAREGGPPPTAVLLHGFPGNDQSPLGLGPALMGAGINALAFNYRGTWGSEGLYTAGNSLEDVRSVLRFLRSPSMVQRFSVDATSIALIGYSFGGAMALLGSLTSPAIHHVASIAGADMGWAARQCQRDQAFRAFLEQDLDESFADPQVARGPGGKACIDELVEIADEYDLASRAPALAAKDLLFIGGWRDQQATLEDHVLPVYRALQQSGAERLSIEMFDADHRFETVREALAQRVIAWMRGWAGRRPAAETHQAED